ncbi:hypothetical protein A2773_02790 [Candidatus Gottesmanbacteria bacterium RIFCSPHIGHO2_01_FULL_39_10]|uniref:Uncharacterized protein n=1 Tax=Candidatus Gottesmanbacteria bacterium RIFCSPHIGHO2_01_FULL_39_10 TaxID=1798375 RepID=A0A1F5ZPY5_9BACT|nr:MAG: hypothetical protein A2773_02790 [Candidatus Gottesmanbacteria bacterium RIFCSPHIGHO2_01_FULL_39_10]
MSEGTMIHPTYTTVLNLINSRFPQKKTLRILDYGCGSGYFLEIFGKTRIGEYYGYDLSEKSIQCAKKTHHNRNVHFFHIQKDSASLLKEKKNIDVLVLIGVLQYMSNKEFSALFKNAKKLLTPNGVIIISCSVDHIVYRAMNVLHIFSPHKLIHRKYATDTLKRAGFGVIDQFERGILLSPIFSQLMTIFDILDKLIFSTKGTIGPIGKIMRGMTNILLSLEYRLPVDYGYTLFIMAGKDSV